MLRGLTKTLAKPVSSREKLVLPFLRNMLSSSDQTAHIAAFGLRSPLFTSVGHLPVSVGQLNNGLSSRLFLLKLS